MMCRDILKIVVNAKKLSLLMMNRAKDERTKKDFNTLIGELDNAIFELRRRH